jgi:hypothetical protein
MEIGIAELLVGATAVWRVTHLLHAEDGPWGVLARLRRLAGDSVWGEALDCFYCLSIWTALPFALCLGSTWKAKVLLWPALSGAAILLDRATARPSQNVPMATWYEEPEKDAREGEAP